MQTLKGWAVPAPYYAQRVVASGAKDVVRWGIYKGRPIDEYYIGDIVYFKQENSWASQPDTADAEDLTEYKTPEEAFKALARVMCSEVATFIVMYDTEHEDDEAATRVCRNHLADSVEAHWKAKSRVSPFHKLTVTPMNPSAGFFCERDTL